MSKLNIRSFSVSKGVFIHHSAEVSEDAVIGAETYIWNQVQIREGCIIGDGCVLSKDVYIDLRVTVGDRVKIQNGVSVYHGVILEDDVFLGPHMVFTNDLFPRSFNPKYEVKQTLVQKGSSIGANATIICGNRIGEYAMVGAGSVVTKDVPRQAMVVGVPAKIIGWVCECGKPLNQIDIPVGPANMACSACANEYDIDWTMYRRKIKRGPE